MGKPKNTPKHKGWTGNTDPAKYGIDVNAPFRSTPGGVFDVNKMKQVNNVNDEDKDQKRRARTG